MPKNKKRTAKYHNKIKKLNQLGVTNLNETRKQSRATQTRVNRLWKQLSAPALNPQYYDEKELTPREVKLFKSLDYPVFKNKVFINHEGADHLQVTQKRINGNMETVVIKKHGKKRTTDIIAPRDTIFERLENAEKNKDKLKRGEFITVKIGNNSHFSSRFKSMKALQHYLDNKFSPQQPLRKKDKRNAKQQAKLKQELIESMSIVRFTK